MGEFQFHGNGRHWFRGTKSQCSGEMRGTETRLFFLLSDPIPASDWTLIPETADLSIPGQLCFSSPSLLCSKPSEWMEKVPGGLCQPQRGAPNWGPGRSFLQCSHSLKGTEMPNPGALCRKEGSFPLLQMTPPTEEHLWSSPNSQVNKVPKTRQNKLIISLFYAMAARRLFFNPWAQVTQSSFVTECTMQCEVGAFPQSL